MKIIIIILIGAFLLGGCTVNTNQPVTPNQVLLQQSERLIVMIAVDKVNQAINKDKNLSPSEKQAAQSILLDLPQVIANPHSSTVVQTVWNAAKPFLQSYSLQADAAIGPLTFKEIDNMMITYIANLKIQEATPTTKPS